MVRTAISAEPRDGRLYLFMPPTSALEDYLGLVAAIEGINGLMLIGWSTAFLVTVMTRLHPDRA